MTFIPMTSVKIALFAVCCTAVALAACRREEATYVPMKLGAEVQQTTAK